MLQVFVSQYGNNLCPFINSLSLDATSHRMTVPDYLPNHSYTHITSRFPRGKVEHKARPFLAAL